MTGQTRTYTSISKRLISLALLLVPLTMMAQENKKVMVEQQDTIPTFRGVAVSVDVVGVGQKIFGSYGQYEAALRVNLKDKYFPIIELGIGKADANEVTTTMEYNTSAPYGRIGIDFNVLKNKHDDYRVYVGGRYAYTSFKFDVRNAGVTDPVWGDRLSYDYQDNKSTWHWLEAVAGVDAKIWKFIRLGWSVRYKRRLFHSDPDIGKPWYVPGFGKQGGSRLGGTFNIIFEI